MVEYNYEDLWKTFQSKSKKAERQAKSNGMPFFKLYKDKQQFIDNFRVARADFGDTKTINQTITYMVDKQRYTYSKAQAEHLVQSLAAQGRDVSLREARIFGGLTPEEFEELTPKQQGVAKEIREHFNEIDVRYHELRAQGLNAAEAKRIIGIEYYGSDPE